ncbi:MAG: acylphosphatase, partial [Gammaproteobacteria bacterium]|nr:acylphosphatase [Gammaproteobacteria bacterium]
MAAARIILAGHVQGVGFRPFVYRLALQHGLRGAVQNQMGEVEIVAAGSAASLQRFQDDLIAH